MEGSSASLENFSILDIITKDVWMSIICANLSVVDVSRLEQTCRYFQTLLISREYYVKVLILMKESADSFMKYIESEKRRSYGTYRLYLTYEERKQCAKQSNGILSLELKILRLTSA